MKKAVIALLIFCYFFGSSLQCVLCQIAQPKLFAPGVISTEFMETSATFTPDEKTVYFTRSDFQFSDNTILESHFAGGKWKEPEVASFSGEWRDSEPHVAPNGTKLFFVSNRPVKAGGKPLVANFGGRSFPGANIWYVEKKGNDWGEPIHIEGAVNAVPSVYNPSVAKNGTLYFSGVLPDGEGKNQIYRSVLKNGEYGAPERLSFSDTKYNHIDPSIAPDESFIVFSANRPGGLGASADVHICFQTDGKWGEPVNLGTSVNSSFLENAPSLAPDGKTLYFTSMRPKVITFPKLKENKKLVLKRLREAENGSRNIWEIDLSDWINRR